MNFSASKKTVDCLLFGCLAFSSASAFCQTAAGDGQTAEAKPTSSSSAPAPAKAASDIVSLDSVVVTGTSGRQQKMQAPYAISTIDAKAIQQQAPRSAVDLLRSLPGINVENSGGEGGGENVVIRGLPFSGFRLLDMQEDGLPLFESNFERQLQIDELYRVDLNTERVEMVRGGTAPIFSNNAAGGVVNFITQHGSATAQHDVGISLGSNGLRRVDAQLSGPVTDDLQYNISGFQRQSDGQRATGFKPANDGGQIKLGGTYFFDKGSVFADFKYLNDRSVFYSAIPLLDPRNGNSLDDLIDRHSGTLASNSYRYVNFLAGNGRGGVESLSRDLADGIHPDVKTFTVGGDVDLGDGWNLSDKARYADGSVGFDAILNGSPTDAASFLKGFASSAKAAFPTSTSLRYVIAGTNTPYNPATTAGLVMPNTWSSTRTDYTYAVNDLRLTKVIDDAQWGSHELTFGTMFSHFQMDQQQLGNTLLTNVKNQPDALDIQALDAKGNVVGYVTQNGFTSYGSGDLAGSVEGHAVSFYSAENWKITDAWHSDIGIRYEERYENGERGIIGPISVATTGPLAARTITGVTGYAPYSKTQYGTAWTIGTSLQFTPSVNAFARYTSAYSLPRFSDQWTNINNGVAGTLPNGEAVPVTPIKQGELGVKFLTSTFQSSIIAFISRFNKLNSSTYVANAQGVLSNQPLLINTTTKGVEWEAAWSPVKDFRLNGSLTLQSPKIDGATTFNIAYTSNLAGNLVPRVPKYVGTLQPAYLFNTAWGPAQLYATVNTVGRRYQDFVNTSILPGYTTLDLGINAQIGKNVSLTMAVLNVNNSSGLTEGNARAPVSNSLVASDASVGRPIFGRTFNTNINVKW